MLNISFKKKVIFFFLQKAKLFTERFLFQTPITITNQSCHGSSKIFKKIVNAIYANSVEFYGNIRFLNLVFVPHHFLQLQLNRTFEFPKYVNTKQKIKVTPQIT